MPDPTLDEAIKEAFARAPSNVAQVHTLEVRHASMTEPLYLVKGFQHRVITLETAEVVTAVATPFEFRLPPTNDNGVQELHINLDDVNKRVSRFVRTCVRFSSPITVIYRPYLSTDLTVPRMTPPLRLTLKNASIKSGMFSARATPADFLNARFPTVRYTVENFPGLKGA